MVKMNGRAPKITTHAEDFETVTLSVFATNPWQKEAFKAPFCSNVLILGLFESVIVPCPRHVGVPPSFAARSRPYDCDI